MRRSSCSRSGPGSAPPSLCDVRQRAAAPAAAQPHATAVGGATARPGSERMTPARAQQTSRPFYLQVAPLALVLLLFFVIPVALVVLVSFFRYQMLVGMVPQFTTGNYVELVTNPTTWALYLSTP